MTYNPYGQFTVGNIHKILVEKVCDGCGYVIRKFTTDAEHLPSQNAPCFCEICRPVDFVVMP